MYGKRIVYYLRRRKKIRKDKEVRPREKEKFKKKKKNWSSQWAIQFSTYLQKTIYQSSY